MGYNSEILTQQFTKLFFPSRSGPNAGTMRPKQQSFLSGGRLMFCNVLIFTDMICSKAFRNYSRNPSYCRPTEMHCALDRTNVEDLILFPLEFLF